MDVMNRGMNGYNSRWGAAVLPLILEEILGPAASPLVTIGDGECIDSDPEDRGVASMTVNATCPNSENMLELLTDVQTRKFAEKLGRQIRRAQYTFLVGFGANDSCLPDGPHSRNHVHIEEYKNNLMQMIRMIQTWNAKYTAVALMTPPPCDTEIQCPSRDNENATKFYAEACIEVANAMSVPVIDLWNGMQLPISNSKDGQDDVSLNQYTSRQQWKIDYLSDGLHLTALGNYRLYELVVEALDRSEEGEASGSLGLGLSFVTLPRNYPDHSMVDATHPQKSFGTEGK